MEPNKTGLLRAKVEQVLHHYCIVLCEQDGYTSTPETELSLCLSTHKVTDHRQFKQMLTITLLVSRS